MDGSRRAYPEGPRRQKSFSLLLLFPADQPTDLQSVGQGSPVFTHLEEQDDSDTDPCPHNLVES